MNKKIPPIQWTILQGEEFIQLDDLPEHISNYLLDAGLEIYNTIKDVECLEHGISDKNISIMYHVLKEEIQCSVWVCCDNNADYCRILLKDNSQRVIVLYREPPFRFL